MAAMDIGTPALPSAEQDLKLLLEKYTMEEPLETAFHGYGHDSTVCIKL